jgi:BirA family transcriptional regulator, biotin operon repressor / biotin---[acetyl-CoA-carboxylase] ligase
LKFLHDAILLERDIQMYSDHLHLTTFDALLKTQQLGRASQANEVWEEIDSTNTRATTLAKSGAPHGVIVAARQQTAGRGRQGRTWVSPKDAGLYISFLLRPELPLTELPLVSLATGVAAARAIEAACGLQIGLKWVNDIIAERRKLGGILAEMPDSKSLVIGIGINVRAVERPPEIAAMAISIEEATGTRADVNVLAAQLAYELEQSYTLLCRGERTAITESWKQKSVTIGRPVRATASGEDIEGDAIDIERDGALVVRTASGVRTFHAGEISIRNPDGSYI